MEVIADSIDKTHFTYECPNCSVFLRKDGKPRKYPKRVYHRHGSCGDLSNRTEHRQSHCLKNAQEVRVIISDATEKIEK